MLLLRCLVPSSPEKSFFPDNWKTFEQNFTKHLDFPASGRKYRFLQTGSHAPYVDREIQLPWISAADSTVPRGLAKR